MSTWQEAVALIDTMLCVDQQLQDTPTWAEVREQLDWLGSQQFHRAYYDTGIFSQSLVREVLQTVPDGLLTRALTWLIQERQTEYTSQTLRAMYGMPE